MAGVDRVTGYPIRDVGEAAVIGHTGSVEFPFALGFDVDVGVGVVGAVLLVAQVFVEQAVAEQPPNTIAKLISAHVPRLKLSEEEHHVSGSSSPS